MECFVVNEKILEEIFSKGGHVEQLVCSCDRDFLVIYININYWDNAKIVLRLMLRALTMRGM